MSAGAQEEIPPLLHALSGAVRAGQIEDAAALRLRLLELRQQDPRGPFQPGGRLTPGDMDLLHGLGADLRTLGRPDEALEVYELAQALAIEQDDAFAATLLGLHRAHCLIALLKFDAAASILIDSLGLHALWAEGGWRPAGELIVSGVALGPDLHALRAEALHVTGRLLAAVGNLGEAAHALRAAVELARRQRLVTVPAQELALLLGQILLDRADFARLDALARRFEDNAQADERVRWRLLYGTALHLRGRLSEADRLLAEVSAAASALDGRHGPACVTAALWQRVQVLITLNRLDEAEAALTELAQRPGLTANEVATLAGRLAARRMSATLVPLTAKEILEPRPLDTPAVTERTEAGEVPLCRTRERVCEEWTRLSHIIQLDLHHGRIEQARARHRWLDGFAASVDSPMIQARRLHLRALVAYHSDAADTAEEAAQGAILAYADLGLLGEEWNAHRLLLWAQRRSGAGAGVKAAQLAREQALLSQVQQGLDAADRIQHQLNKWSGLDDRVGHACAALRDRMPRRDTWLRRWLFQLQTRRTLAQVLSWRRCLAGWLWPWALPVDTAILSYVVLPDRLEVFVVHRDGCSLLSPSPGGDAERPAHRIELWLAVRALLKRLWYDAEEDPPLLQARERVARMLGLEQVVAALPARVRQLCIIPDDVLFHVPFAALPVDGQPLLSHGYAVSLLPVLRWRRAPRQGGLRPKRGLGVAVPRTRVCLREGAPAELAHAVAEVEAIEACLREDRVVFSKLLGDDATRRGVLEHLPGADAIHFACHGEFDPQSPAHSGLLLADEMLTVADLEGLDLRALELAVLGSCWGANVAVLPGRELVGMPVALLHQGAGAVITPLWRVEDAFSCAFSKDLYAALQEHGVAAGLAQAQRRWRMQTPPRNWASYLAYLGRAEPCAGLMARAVR